MPGVISKSQNLQEVIKRRLIPFIHSRGFEHDKRELFKPDPYGILFQRFIRWNGCKLELLEIQFDKRGRAKFVFNLGVVPPEGVENPICHYKQLEVAYARSGQRAKLCAGRFMGIWFALSTSKIPFLGKRSADDVVDRAIQLFPQAEAWLREGIIGPNMRAAAARNNLK